MVEQKKKKAWVVVTPEPCKDDDAAPGVGKHESPESPANSQREGKTLVVSAKSLTEGATNEPSRETKSKTGNITSSVTDYLWNGQTVRWQWSHRTGFRDYPEAENQRVEAAFQEGKCHFRLKAGKNGSTPMELFFIDMLQYDPETGNTRPIQRTGPDSRFQRFKRRIYQIMHTVETRGTITPLTFARLHPHASKPRKMTRRGSQVHNVSNSLHGTCSLIASSQAMLCISTLTVLANIVWIGYDADKNTAMTITDADTEFKVVENLFCTFFLLELIMRSCGSYACFRDCLQDAWFAFDAALVLLMVLEIWMVPIIFFFMADDDPDLGILRITRVLRVLRLARIARLLRAAPEVMTLLKGIISAMRSVFCTTMLLVVLLYMFGIIFKTQVDQDNPDLVKLFPSVGDAMWTLLIAGTFLDGVGEALNMLGTQSWLMSGIFLLFIFLSSFTLLNMLIGILCDVVHQVSERERERHAEAKLRGTLLEIFECYDKEECGAIGENEYATLVNNPQVQEILLDFDVDVSDLITIKDVLYEDTSAVVRSDMTQAHLPSSAKINCPVSKMIPMHAGTGNISAGDGETNQPREQQGKNVSSMRIVRLTFEDFIQVVLRLRGNNHATVTDITELRKFIGHRLEKLQWEAGPQPDIQPDHKPDDFQQQVLGRLEDLAIQQTALGECLAGACKRIEELQHVPQQLQELQRSFNGFQSSLQSSLSRDVSIDLLGSQTSTAIPTWGNTPRPASHPAPLLAAAAAPTAPTTQT